jgi:hypothetical protein
MQCVACELKGKLVDCKVGEGRHPREIGCYSTYVKPLCGALSAIPRIIFLIIKQSQRLNSTVRCVVQSAAMYGKEDKSLLYKIKGGGFLYLFIDYNYKPAVS